MSEYRELLEQAKLDGVTNEEKMWKSIDSIDEIFNKLKDSHPMLFKEFMKKQNMILYGNHFSQIQAKDIINKMHHKDINGGENVGEHYSYEYASKVVSKYAPDINVNDMYVALNATYHDWVNLFKKWFNEVSDEKIIQATLQFWFLDEDYSEPKEKVWLYFN